MSYELVIGGEERHPLASIHGWEDVREWAEDLPLDSYFDLVQFIEHNVTENIGKVINQLDQVLMIDRPRDPTIFSTLVQMRDNLKEAPEGSLTAFVSDGMGE